MTMPENTLSDTIPSTSYTVTLEQDGDDLLLPIPEELLQQLQWNTGDMLDWDLQLDNTIILRKIG
jgi:antitoxin component of MazEF toxin-antitoxin module